MIPSFQNHGLRFRADYSAKALKERQTLRVEWAKGRYSPDTLLQDMRGHKYELLSRVNKDILGLPPPFAQILAALTTRNKPKSITQKKWDRVLLNLSGLLSDNAHWLHQIIHNGWRMTDVFGCHSTSPQNRIECMGLLLLLDGKEVIEVLRDRIVLKTKGGAPLTYRRSLSISLGQTTLDLLPEEE